MTNLAAAGAANARRYPQALPTLDEAHATVQGA